MNKIARVFARKTSMCPTDQDCYFGLPEMYMPEYNEVHISVTFTWDIERGKYLKHQWEAICDTVKMGGCAFDDSGYDFIAGMYLKQGCIFTSKGCPNNCDWCLVPRREGRIKELPIIKGNIIMDNNLLACSKKHIRNVIQMLKTQKGISFNQGLDSRRITDEFVEDIRGLKIKDIWLAMDYSGAEMPLKKAVDKLKKYFNKNKLRCYVLIGRKNDTIKKAEQRLMNAYKIGTYPFAMRYRTPSEIWHETFEHSEREWNILTRKWTRPAIYKAFMKKN